MIVSAYRRTAATPNELESLLSLLVEPLPVDDILLDIALEDLWCTAAGAAAIVQLGMRISDSNQVGEVAKTISCLVEGKIRPIRLLFGTPLMRDALIKMAFSATTPESIDWLTTAIHHIAHDDPSNQQVFGTNLMRDVLIELALRVHAPSESVWKIARAINSIAEGENPSIVTVFATAPMRDALIRLASFAGTQVTVQFTAQAICSLTRSTSPFIQKIFGVAEMRDTLIQMAFATSAPGNVWHVPRAIFNITDSSPSIKAVFRTPEMRNALIHMVSPASAQWVAAAIGKLTDCDECRDIDSIFGTPTVRDALIQMASLSTTPEVDFHVAQAIAFIVWERRSMQHVFGCVQVRDVLIRMALSVSRDRRSATRNVLAIAMAIANITHFVDSAIQCLVRPRCGMLSFV